MKISKIFTILLFLAPLSFLNAQSVLTVEIINLDNNKGHAIIALLDKNEKNVMDRTTKITNNKCTVTFQNVKHDQYAIRLFHDENDNKELDTNALGIPKEGFGFSNDAMGKFGPKDFSEWLFEVSGDMKITISANYLFR